MKRSTQRKLSFLAGFALYFAVLWTLWDTVLVYPLKIFVVLLHEISHALVSVATGGTIEHIVLDPRQGGACYCPGGNALLTLSAGYLGSLGWGAVMVEAARSPRVRARWVNGFIGAMVVALTVAFVRSGFGIAFGILFGAALVLASQRLSAHVNRIALMSLGLTSALYAILDIKSDVLDRPELESDAFMLGQLTHTPTELWGIVWIVVALGVAFLLFRRAWRDA